MNIGSIAMLELRRMGLYDPSHQVGLWTSCLKTESSQNTSCSAIVEEQDGRIENISEDAHHGIVGTSKPYEQEASKPPDKVVRRLAQNREAARKSRLRKKAYIQQLEISRIKLAQLEQGLLGIITRADRALALLLMGFQFPLLAALRQVYSTGRSCPSHNHRAFFLGHRNRALIYRRRHGDHAIRAHGNNQSAEDGDKAEGIFYLGLSADAGLSVGKALTGYICGSTAIIADAAHSASDVVLSGIALLSYRAAKAPRDKDHPYGHGKFESLGALGISFMLLGTAGGIAWHSFDVLQGVFASTSDMIRHTHNHDHGVHHHGFDLEHPILALSMTIFSISIKEGLYWITKRAGEKQGSGLMKANAWHHHADAISSIFALVGVGGSLLGVPFIDPLAGIVVSGMIFKAGVETGYQSVMELADAGAPLTVLAPIRQTITQVEGVEGCHRLRGRKAGSFLYLDVHIEVDPFLSVSAAHDIGENVRQLVQKSHNQVAEVFIHIDPSYSQQSSMSNQRMTLNNLENQNANISKQQEAEAVVSCVISSLFQEKMSVEHVTLHKFGENVLLQVQVLMPPEILIKDAINMARESEKGILKASSSINQVSILLRLGHPIQVDDRAF